MVSVRVSGFAQFGGVRTDLFERAFGHEPPADVLIDEDVAGFGGDLRRAEIGGVFVGAVGADAVWGAGHQHWPGLCAIFGDIDGGEQADTIARMGM